MKFIILLAIVLGVAALAQMARVYELSAALRNKREEHITKRDNKLNAKLWILFMIAFYGFFGWLTFRFGDGGLGPAASVHGEETDWLLDVNFVIIILVFFLTSTLLFGFSSKYVYQKDRKALYYPHNNKLELIWTVIPAVVLAGIIIFGLQKWFQIQDVASEEAKVIEVYAEQFNFTSRYAGENNKLGESNYKLLYTGAGKSGDKNNPLGLITKKSVATQKANLTGQIVKLEGELDGPGNEFIPDEERVKKEERLERTKVLKRRLVAVESDVNADKDAWANDDIIVKGELHLVVGQEYEFKFRSQDVMHSAYFPHFRAQMNCVPGLETRLKFKPTITTVEMQKIKNDPNFYYVLLCNKICGASHSNMNMKIVVETQEEFNAYMAQQAKFGDTSH